MLTIVVRNAGRWAGPGGLQLSVKRPFCAINGNLRAGGFLQQFLGREVSILELPLGVRNRALLGLRVGLERRVLKFMEKIAAFYICATPNPVGSFPNRSVTWHGCFVSLKKRSSGQCGPLLANFPADLFVDFLVEHTWEG